MRASPTDNDRVINYRKLRNLVNTETRKYRVSYAEQELRACSVGSREWWKAANRHLLGRTIERPQVHCLQQGDTAVRDMRQIANNLVQCFSIMYAANTKTKRPQDACACTGNHGHVTELDVRRVVDGLNTRKANLERIPVAVLQCVSDVIAEPLAFIYNMVLGTDIIPQYLKSAMVIPLHKGGSRELASNYRPISVISVFGTIFEKLIAPPIYSYVSERNLLPDRQFGFRKGMSCINAATLLLSSVVDRLDSNCVGVLFVYIKMPSRPPTMMSLGNGI
jgi:hypothetical protein